MRAEFNVKIEQQLWIVGLALVFGQIYASRVIQILIENKIIEDIGSSRSFLTLQKLVTAVKIGKWRGSGEGREKKTPPMKPIHLEIAYRRSPTKCGKLCPGNIKLAISMKRSTVDSFSGIFSFDCKRRKLRW